jgi:hypothetical protein
MLNMKGDVEAIMPAGSVGWILSSLRTDQVVTWGCVIGGFWCERYGTKEKQKEAEERK